MELHCSQTLTVIAKRTLLFETPMELHCSQTILYTQSLNASLRPLWNYTALKLFASFTFYLIV